jgi:hypothetical protein
MNRSAACLIFGALAAISGFCYATRDTHDTVWWKSECEREDLHARLEIARLKLSDDRAHTNEALFTAAVAKKAEMDARIVDLKAQTEQLRASVRQVETRFAENRAAWIQEARARSIGREWDEFVAGDGRVFQQAKVVAVNDVGVTLRHLHGSATVRFADLNDDQKILFGLDSELAAQAEAAEQKLAANYHQWVEEGQELAEFRQAVKRAGVMLSRMPLKPSKSFRRRSASRLPATSTDTSPLRIGRLGESRLLDTSRRIYTRPLNNTTIYYYGSSNNAVFSSGNACGPSAASPPVIKLPSTRPVTP